MKTKNEIYEDLQSVIVDQIKSKISMAVDMGLEEIDKCNDKYVISLSANLRSLLELHEWLSMNMEENI